MLAGKILSSVPSTLVNKKREIAVVYNSMIVSEDAKNNESITHFFSKKVGRAIFDYKMIEDGDNILVAVSGGKDSLSLLKILQYRQKFCPIKYKLIAVHIDLGYKCVSSGMLSNYFEKCGVDYKIVNANILKDCASRKDITCFWCSWNRRKALFETAQELKCVKIAFGHHQDDIAETILMNMFFNAEISGMNPRQELFKGKISIIRPLAYVGEKEVVRFAKAQDFPEHKCCCPNAGKTRRNDVKEIITSLEKHSPSLRTNICRSIKRVKEEYIA